jgi:hypothetical protein
MCLKLLNVITYSSSEYRVRSNDGRGGSIFHQTFPVRYFPDLKESGFLFAIAIFDSEQLNPPDFDSLKITLYQNNIIISEDIIPSINEKVSTVKTSGGKVISWLQGAATPNAHEGLVKIKVNLVSKGQSIEVEGESNFILKLGDPMNTNSFLAFFLNIICKFSKKYRDHIFNKSIVNDCT